MSFHVSLTSSCAQTVRGVALKTKDSVPQVGRNRGDYFLVARMT